MSFVVDISELIIQGRFGPLGRGATQREVRAALGEPDARNAPGALVEPASIWIYGRKLCYGHLEFHFLEDKLWSIFADYLPLGRYHSERFCFEPGVLGGRAYPSVTEVCSDLIEGEGDGDALIPGFEQLDPRWSDPPPPEKEPRIETRLWNKIVRMKGTKDGGSLCYAQLVWPSGSTLGVGYHHATTASGERLLSEDVVLVMTVPMLLEDA